MVFRLKESTIDGGKEWRRKIGDGVLFFGWKGGDPWKGAFKLTTPTNSVRHS